jgi:hypothetical protein
MIDMPEPSVEDPLRKLISKLRETPTTPEPRSAFPASQASPAMQKVTERLRPKVKK